MKVWYPLYFTNSIEDIKKFNTLNITYYFWLLNFKISYALVTFIPLSLYLKNFENTFII